MAMTLSRCSGSTAGAEVAFVESLTTACDLFVREPAGFHDRPFGR